MVQPSPYITTPVPDRPRMYNTKIAQAIWTAVPVITIGFAAAVPFVVAAVKGVIKPWVPAVYVLAEILTFGTALALDDGGKTEHPLGGLLILALMLTATTHAALLDTCKVPGAK
ncbi:hypothetical protein ACFWAT_20705 [Streptomyces syringium]|uniref:hypothetical protein n=1 Tax=Streptomyces syringium TaxID=76729 RepID=UPI003650AB76